jgi:hypothetical protein
MTISSLNTRVDYVGDGTSTVFAVPFQFFLPSDLTVIRRDSTTGAETVLVLATDYTVTGGDNALGTVTLSTAALSGTSLVILRDTLRVQETDYVDYDPFPAESHEKALDRLTMQTQELAREVERRLALRRTDPITQALLPTKESRANRLLGFDGDGAPIAVALDESGSVIVDNDTIIAILNNYLNDLFPVGMVILWAGSVASISSGWALCDGTNGTPDLRNRFVVGAGSTYSVGGTGGAVSGTTSTAGAHTHGGATGSTALTTAQMPTHFHSLGSNVVSLTGSGGQITGSGTFSNGALNTQNEGSGEAHNHTITSGGDHTHTLATLPPYYALCYIMRTGTYFTTPSEIGVGALPASVTTRVIQFAVGDETTDITTGTAKITLRAPYAMTITSIRASLNVVSTSGVVTVDVNVGATSPATILSTKLTIDANEKSSLTAATPAVISNTAIADDDEIVVDIDTAGTGAKGLKVTIIGTVPA